MIWIWLVVAGGVGYLRTVEIQADPDAMPGGGWKAVALTALMWPLLVVAFVIAFFLMGLGLL